MSGEERVGQVLKWPYSNPPKIGELHFIGSVGYRIVDYQPKGLPSYDRKVVTLTLEPYR